MRPTALELEEFRQDMMEDDRICYEHECEMHSNLGYAINSVNIDLSLDEAIATLFKGVEELHRVGWDEIDIHSLIEKKRRICNCFQEQSPIT